MNSRILIMALVLSLSGQWGLLAQTASDDNEGTKIEFDQANSIGRFLWWGRSGRTYFIQHSDNLLDAWQWVPLVEIGDDSIKEWGFTFSGDKFFLRLKHVGEVSVAQNVWAAFTTTGTVNVGWSASEPAGVTRWVIQRQLLGGEWVTVGSTSYGGRTWEDTTLPPGAQALYRVIGEVQLEQDAPIASSAPTGTNPQGGDPGHGIQATNYANIPTTWWQQFFAGLAPEERPSPDEDGDSDGLTNHEEFTASVWVASKKTWIGPNPTMPDTDDDGVEDSVDGWANVPEYAPTRLPAPTYAVIDLGEDLTPYFTNNRGDAVVKTSTGQWKFWRNGQFESIEFPADAVANPRNAVGMNNAGKVAINFNVPTTVLLSIYFEGYGSHDIVSAHTSRQGAAIWHSGGTITELSGPDKQITEFRRTSTSTNPEDHAIYAYESLGLGMAAMLINDADQVLGTYADIWFHELDGTPSTSSMYSIVNRRSAWQWPGGAIGEEYLYVEGWVAFDEYGFEEDEQLGMYGEADFFEPRFLTSQGVAVGIQMSYPRGSVYEHFPVGGPVYSTEGYVHELPLNGLVSVSSSNHILGGKNNKPAFLIDETAGHRLDQQTTAEPAYGSPFVWDEEKHGSPLLQGKLNSRFQVLSGNFLWQNGKSHSLNTLVPSATSTTPAWQILGGADLADNGIILASAKKLSDNSNHAVLLLPFEVAPEFLKVNSDFDEQKIDNATGYAKPDNGDENLKAERGDNQNKTVTDDLHKGFFGVNPNTLPSDFYTGATVTITKKVKVDEDTGQPETGTIRLYAIKDLGSTGEQSTAIPISTGEKPTISSSSPANLAAALYGASSTVPKGDGVTYWIEGVDPGPITLEFKYVKGDLTFSNEQKFKVLTKQTKQQWQEEIRERLKLQTRVAGDEVDVNTHHAGNGLSGNVKQVKAVYAYYQQLYLQHENQFMWAGMARTASASIYAAMADAAQPGTAGAFVGVQFDEVEKALLYGQWLIYADLGWPHRAYEASGIGALKYVKEDLNEDFTLTPWTQIDAGIAEEDQDAINAGNRELLRREQTEVVLPAYNIIRIAVPEGSRLTIFNWFAENPMPGGPPIQNVVPDGDITNTAQRWQWIDDTSWGMLAIWNGTASSPLAPSFSSAKRKELVEKDLREAARPYLNYASDVP